MHTEERRTHKTQFFYPMTLRFSWDSAPRKCSGLTPSHNTRARGSGGITFPASPKLLPHHVSDFDHGDVPPTQLREPASRYAKSWGKSVLWFYANLTLSVKYGVQNYKYKMTYWLDVDAKL